MIIDYREQVETLTKDMDEKRRKRLKIDLLLRLMKKLEPLEDDYIASLFDPLMDHLKQVVSEGVNPRYFNKQFKAIQKQVEKEFELVPSGSVKERHTGTWIAIGIALGAGTGNALGNVAVGIGVWIAIGTAIGSGIGEKKEKEAAEKGLLY